MARAKKRAVASAPVEGRWTLPEDWRWARACDFARIVGGSTPKNASDPSNFDPHGTPWITPADLSGYRQPTIAAGRRNLASHLVAKGNILPAGSVLISSRAPVGYCAVAQNEVTTNQGFRSLVLSGNVDPFFIRYYILYSKSYLEEHASGTTFQELSGSALSDLLFPLPSLKQQRSVVARVNELFAVLDDGEAALAGAQSNLKTWRNALLKAAVTGELTSDWRAGNPRKGERAETGADILARILDDRRTRWLADPRNKGKRYVEPARPDTSDLTELPEGWTWAVVEQLGKVVTGGTPPTSEAGNYGGEAPFYTPGDLDAGFHLTTAKRTISLAGLATIRPIPASCVLVTCIGATIGKVGLNAVAGATNQQINTIVPDIPALSAYIFHYFDGPGRYLVMDGASSTTMPILNKSAFSRLPVPIPPEDEAREITRLIEAEYAGANAASVELIDCSAALATLRHSILAAAFRGDLIA